MITIGATSGLLALNVITLVLLVVHAIRTVVRDYYDYKLRMKGRKPMPPMGHDDHPVRSMGKRK